MSRKIDLPVEEIVLKWKKGATLQELADEYGTSFGTMRNRIKEWYEEKGKVKPKKGGRKKLVLPVEEIVLKWKNGATLQELADEYGTNFGTMRNRIKEWYEEKGKVKPKKGKVKPKKGTKKKIELPVEEIVSKWENGATQMELADEYGISYVTIRNRIKEWYEEKGKVKPKKGGKKKLVLPVEEIVLKWKNGVTPMELVDEYGTSYGIISNRINEYYMGKGKEKSQDNTKKNELKAIKDRVIRGPNIVINYLKRGATPEQILEIAEKNRVIIPDSVMQEAVKKVQKTSEERIQKDVGRDIDE